MLDRDLEPECDNSDEVIVGKAEELMQALINAHYATKYNADIIAKIFFDAWKSESKVCEVFLSKHYLSDEVMWAVGAYFDLDQDAEKNFWAEYWDR